MPAVYRLPAELTAEILGLVVHAMPPSPTRDQQLFYLCSTLASWRKVAIQMSSLWAVITMQDKSFAVASKNAAANHPTRYATYIERSQNRPLLVHVSTITHGIEARSEPYSDCYNSDYEGPPTEEFEYPRQEEAKTAFWKTFCQECADRCVELTLRIPYDDADCFPLPLPLMPRLRALSLIHLPTHTQARIPRLFAPDQPMDLDTVRIGEDWADFRPQIPIPWTTIKVLHIGGHVSTLQQLVQDCLPACIELYELELLFDGSPRWTETASVLDLSKAEVLVLPKLHTLILWDLHFSSIKKLFDAPLLRHLTIGGRRSAPIRLPEGLETTDSSLRPSHLTELTVSCTVYPSPDPTHPYRTVSHHELCTLISDNVDLETLYLGHRPDAFAALRTTLLSESQPTIHHALRSIHLIGCAPTIFHSEKAYYIMSTTSGGSTISNLDLPARQDHPELCWEAPERMQVLVDLVDRFQAVHCVVTGEALRSLYSDQSLCLFDKGDSGRICVEAEDKSMPPWTPPDVIYGIGVPHQDHRLNSSRLLDSP